MTLTAPQRFSNGNLKPPQFQLPEVNAAHDRLQGHDPRTLSLADFASLGFAKRPLLDVIRQNCIECQCGNQAEVKRCGASGCVFWPYRMNSDPFRAPQSEEQRQAAAERLKQVRFRPAAPTA